MENPIDGTDGKLGCGFMSAEIGRNRYWRW
jgi:hypothetical protein